jgi:hypothetical protein
VPAFRLTTEPNFSPRNSEDVASWQRFGEEQLMKLIVTKCGKGYILYQLKGTDKK